MRLTLAQWLELHRLQRAAVDAVSALREKVTHLTIVHHSRGHAAEVKFLGEVEDKVADADAALLALDFKPVDEWTGGDSADPKNSRLREPQAVHGGLSARRYFTDAEVAEARKKGLIE